MMGLYGFWWFFSCRSHLAGAPQAAQVPMPRGDVNKLIETAESARIKLYKNIEVINAIKIECKE